MEGGKQMTLYHILLNGDWGSDIETVTSLKEVKAKMKNKQYADDVFGIIKGGKYFSPLKVKA